MRAHCDYQIGTLSLWYDSHRPQNYKHLRCSSGTQTRFQNESSSFYRSLACADGGLINLNNVFDKSIKQESDANRGLLSEFDNFLTSRENGHTFQIPIHNIQLNRTMCFGRTGHLWTHLDGFKCYGRKRGRINFSSINYTRDRVNHRPHFHCTCDVCGRICIPSFERQGMPALVRRFLV